MISCKLCVGLDASLGGFGICLASGEAIETEVLSSKKNGDTMTMRMRRYEDLAGRVVQRVAGGGEPAIVLIEGYSYGSPARAVPLGEFGAILRRRLRMLKWPVAEVAPTTIKKFATGKGSGKKLPAVPTHLTKRYGVMFGTDDEYDAFALSKIGQCVIGECEPETKAQREAVATVREKWLAEVAAMGGGS